ncbi:SGT1-domain-containing protein [Lactarius akahatsu]|uniref:SGT1-domain-containing protein n=1 Tax=Lactarius akahatsu TaxID=416441 RepID=A0AAD4LJ54_9AGAM|nr:SGT1-domain-containing protein [Lactarius akahatsu]
MYNRPPSIAEDTIYYVLHPPESSSDRTSATVLALSVQNFVESLLPDFLWHRDTFQVKVVQNKVRSGWILEGWMRVGDSIDDEWCVVWLLREVSKKWDCAISVRDSDGEFLLIEAADDLPSWVTPSVVGNRVWIYRSHLHLIPLSHVSPPSSKRRSVSFSSDDNDDLATTDEFLDISDAVKLVRDTSTSTRAPPQVEQTVWQRIARQRHVHKAKTYLPVDVAKALSVNSALVQKAVEVFYTRDAVQLRAVHKMARFSPQPCLLRTVRLTRTAYAQLVGQKFYPPKVFGRWSEKEGTPEWRWKDLGMKIACGFEMLYQEGRARAEIFDSSSTVVQAQKDALQRDPEFIKYINGIQAAGYFRGEIEGSQLWDALESKALAVFLQSRQEDDASRPSFASQVNAAIANAGDLTPSQDLDDPDDWLTVNAEDLDCVLQGNTSHTTPHTSHKMEVDPENEEHDSTHAQVAKLRDLANKVDSFVTGEGDIEGAMFEDEQTSDGERSDFSDGEFSEVDSDDDEDSARAARQDALEKLVPGIEPSEYGRMPLSFYNRSQRVARVAPENEDTAAEATTSDAGLPRSLPKPSRAPLLSRDRYEGVDSDDDTDESDEPADEDEDEQPELVGEVEVDMAEEEEEFLEFSRQALGISDEHWRQILQERRDRGAYVPTHTATAESQHLFREARTPDAPESRPRRPKAATAGNPHLDSFEAVMQAMDKELARSKNASAGPPNLPPVEKGKGKETDLARGADEDSMDIEEAMDAELKAALEQDEDAEVDVSAEGGLDYNLIKNFLESFKSQGGLSGPVSNLAGRLQPGWGLPRDEA